MNKLLMTTAALFVVGGVTTVLADVSISGNVRFHYDSWSDNQVDKAESGDKNNSMSGSTDIWIKGTHTADSGLSYSGEVRLKGTDAGDKRYLTISDDWGKVTLGKQHSPSYSMSLGDDWRATVSGTLPANVTRASGLMTGSGITTSGKDDKIIFQTPNLGGLKAGISLAGGGADTKANSTEFVAQYVFPIMDGDVTFSYAAANQAAKDSAPASTKASNSEMGAAFSRGPLRVSLVTLTKKATPNKATTAKVEGKQAVYMDIDNASIAATNVPTANTYLKTAATADVAAKANSTVEQKGNELSVEYGATDNMLLNLVMFNSKITKDGTKAAPGNKDDKYSSLKIGVKYTIAPGLYVSLSQTSFKYTDATKGATATAGEDGNKIGNNKGSAMRLRVNVDL